MASDESSSDQDDLVALPHQDQEMYDPDGSDTAHIQKGEREENPSENEPFGHHQAHGVSRSAQGDFDDEGEDDDNIEAGTRVQVAPQSETEPAASSEEEDHSSEDGLEITAPPADEGGYLGDSDDEDQILEGSFISADGGHSLAHRLRPESGKYSPSQTTVRSSLKRALGSDITMNTQPFKRVRSAFNYDYLDLLNADISDAAAQAIPDDEQDLEDSQIGLTEWTSSEKELFFEALSRLGPDNATGISRRIQTKGEMEVMQYLNLLQEGVKALKEDQALTPLDLSHRPAAFELSQACCNALEEAADEISHRQEAYEMNKEQKKWGDHWIITSHNWKVLEKAPPLDMKSAELFIVHRWLQMSERIFMNSAVPEYNWRFVSKHAPAVRATALEDFRSLAVSMTRRLLSTTIAMAEARVRSRVAVGSDFKKVVSWRDVEAAALSLGLKPTAQDFWAKSARRLRLNVPDESSGGGENVGDDDLALLSYDDVEHALRWNDERVERDESLSEAELASVASSGAIDMESESEEESQDGGADGLARSALELGVREEEVQRELKELFWHSALKYPPSHKPKRAARARITSELTREAYTDRLDTRSSYKEEKRMWGVLGKKPLEKPTRVKKPGEAPKQYNGPRLDEFYPTGEFWRDTLDNKSSEWESTYVAAKHESLTSLEDDITLGGAKIPT